MTPHCPYNLRELRRAARLIAPRVRVYPWKYDPSNRDDGACMSPSGPIYIRMHRVGSTTKGILLSSAMAALAHELAHLYVWRHGAKHRAATRLIATLLRLEGWKVARKIHANTGRRKTKYGR